VRESSAFKKGRYRDFSAVAAGENEIGKKKKLLQVFFDGRKGGRKGGEAMTPFRRPLRRGSKNTSSFDTRRGARTKGVTRHHQVDEGSSLRPWVRKKASFLEGWRRTYYGAGGEKKYVSLRP